MRQYKYFVSYSYVNNTGAIGFGCSDITLDYKIIRIETVKEIADFIEKKFNHKNVAIINFILMDSCED